MNKKTYEEELKILCIGNSFSVDTMQYLPQIAEDLGIRSFCFGNLFIGGCSVNRHYANLQNHAAVYTYFVNTGEEWGQTPGVSIEQALKSEDWDFVSIQHGTGDGSRYTLEASYENLPCLVQNIEEYISSRTKVVFNMAWVMEPDGRHPEIRSYEGNQKLMYENLVRVTERTVLPVKGLDKVIPTGTAVQNARATELDGKLSRDGFHLSYGLGRYLAGMTFLKAVTGIDIDELRWAPEEVSDSERELAVRCANHAVEAPFCVTSL